MNLQLHCHGDIDLSQSGMQVKIRSHIARCLRDYPQGGEGVITLAGVEHCFMYVVQNDVVDTVIGPPDYIEQVFNEGRQDITEGQPLLPRVGTTTEPVRDFARAPLWLNPRCVLRCQFDIARQRERGGFRDFHPAELLEPLRPEYLSIEPRSHVAADHGEVELPLRLRHIPETADDVIVEHFLRGQPFGHRRFSFRIGRRALRRRNAPIGTPSSRE